MPFQSRPTTRVTTTSHAPKTKKRRKKLAASEEWSVCEDEQENDETAGDNDACSSDTEDEQPAVAQLPPELLLLIMNLLSESGFQSTLLSLLLSNRAMYFSGVHLLYRKTNLVHSRLLAPTLFDLLKTRKWTGTRKLSMLLSHENVGTALDILRATSKLEALSVVCPSASLFQEFIQAPRFPSIFTSLSYLHISIPNNGISHLDPASLPTTLRRFHLTISSGAFSDLDTELDSFYRALEEWPLIVSSQLELYLYGVPFDLESNLQKRPNVCRQLRRILLGLSGTVGDIPQLPDDTGIEIIDIIRTDVLETPAVVAHLKRLNEVRLSMISSTQRRFFQRNLLSNLLRTNIPRRLKRLVLLDIDLCDYQEDRSLERLQEWRNGVQADELVITVNHNDRGNRDPIAMAAQFESEMEKWRQVEGVEILNHAEYRGRETWWPGDEEVG